MKDYVLSISQITIRLVYLLILISLIASIPQAISLSQGSLGTVVEKGVGLRWLREITLIIIVGFALLYMIYGLPGFITSGTCVAILIVSVYTIFLFLRTILLGYEIIVPISGTRIFQYVPLVLIAHYISKITDGQEILNRFANMLRFYVLVLVIIGIFQVFLIPPIQGRTFLGSRPFGTFSKANIYGMTMATCGLWFTLSRIPHRNKWLILCTIMSIISGSRAAALASSLLIIYSLYRSCSDKTGKNLILSITPFILIFLYLGFSNKTISGREGTEIFALEARISAWKNAITNINGIVDLVFGWGLGLTSNTLSTLVGFNVYNGQVICDSLFVSILGGYGLLGIIFYVIAILWTIMHTKSIKVFVFILFQLLLATVFVIFEVFPVNVLLFFLWGILLTSDQNKRRPIMDIR